MGQMGGSLLLLQSVIAGDSTPMAPKNTSIVSWFKIWATAPACHVRTQDYVAQPTIPTLVSVNLLIMEEIVNIHSVSVKVLQVIAY